MNLNDEIKMDWVKTGAYRTISYKQFEMEWCNGDWHNSEHQLKVA